MGVLGEFEPESLLGQAVRAVLKESQIQPLFANVSGPEVPGLVQEWSDQGAFGALVLPPLRADAARVAERFFSVRHSLGAANALRFTSSGVFGFNTESDGFWSQVADIAPSTALVLGAGPAARTACLTLLANGWKVKLWNRTLAKSRVFGAALASLGEVKFAHEADPSGCGLVVNATPLGARAGEHPPVIWTKAGPRTAAFDFVLRHVQTEFLRAASLRGLQTIDGRECLCETLALAVEAATDSKVNRMAIRRALGISADA